jgi:hypothetical protein
MFSYKVIIQCFGCSSVHVFFKFSALMLESSVTFSMVALKVGNPFFLQKDVLFCPQMKFTYLDQLEELQM